MIGKKEISPIQLIAGKRPNKRQISLTSETSERKMSKNEGNENDKKGNEQQENVGNSENDTSTEQNQPPNDKAQQTEGNEEQQNNNEENFWITFMKEAFKLAESSNQALARITNVNESMDLEVIKLAKLAMETVNAATDQIWQQTGKGQNTTQQLIQKEVERLTKDIKLDNPTLNQQLNKLKEAKEATSVGKGKPITVYYDSDESAETRDQPSTSSNQSTRRPYTCTFCNDYHRGSECKTFVTFEERKRQLERIGKCFYCGARHPQDQQCKPYPRCNFCQGTHHPAMCNKR